MSTNCVKTRLVIIDSLKLRQACLVRLLEKWAEANGLGVIAVCPPEELTIGSDAAMVVVNVGGASVLEQEPQLWIKSVRAVAKDVPLVILSDREDRSEICAAFKEGAQGFIATNLEPALAFNALTFLKRGGSFFPASVLLEEPQSVQGEAFGSAGQRAGAPALAHAQIRQMFRVASWHKSPAPNNSARQIAEPGMANVADDTGKGQYLDMLTPRQREVLERLREGKANKVIARDLSMTEATVKVHVRQIMRKFGAANRTQVVLSAMRYKELAAGQGT